MKYNKLYMLIMSLLTIGLIYCFITAPIRWTVDKMVLAIIMCSLGALAVIITYIISRTSKKDDDYPFKGIKWDDNDYYPD